MTISPLLGHWRRHGLDKRSCLEPILFRRIIVDDFTSGRFYELPYRSGAFHAHTKEQNRKKKTNRSDDAGPADEFNGKWNLCGADSGELAGMSAYLLDLFFPFFFWLFKLNDENQQRHCGSRKASCSTNPNVVEKVGYVVAHSDSFTSRIQKKSMSRGFSTSEMYSRLERWIKKVNVSDRVLLRSLWCFTSSHFILVTKMRSQFRKKLKMSRDASKSSKNCRLGFEKKLAKNVRFQ